MKLSISAFGLVGLLWLGSGCGPQVSSSEATSSIVEQRLDGDNPALAWGGPINLAYSRK